MPQTLRTIPRGTIRLLALFCCAASGTAVAATLCVNPGGKAGCESTISAAVTAAAPGDTIRVAQGTYKEQVTITKALALKADEFAQPIIDATGLPNGILIDGMSAAPLAGVRKVSVSGFKIHNANFEGILIVNGTDVTIADNHVLDNNKALNVGAAMCPGIPGFETNEQMDCGEGIHLMGTDHSAILHNEVNDNSGGILTTDETGPSRENLISNNYVHDNPYACGITMASHPPATKVIPTAKLPFGIFHTTVANNESAHNGLGAPGAGAGVGIFAAGPGNTSTGNVIINNKLHDNGLPGVTMHNHGSAPSPAPPVNLNDNAIIGNTIAGNAADTEDAATPGPTGINLYSTAPVYGTLILQNIFEDEAVDIAFKAPVGTVNAHFNDFDTVRIGVDNLGAGFVNATDNWWNCPAGPEGKNCASVDGPRADFTPWLHHRLEE
jgi:parallel beta-helix repeat protein